MGKKDHGEEKHQIRPRPRESGGGRRLEAAGACRATFSALAVLKTIPGLLPAPYHQIKIITPNIYKLLIKVNQVISCKPGKPKVTRLENEQT